MNEINQINQINQTNRPLPLQMVAIRHVAELTQTPVKSSLYPPALSVYQRVAFEPVSLHLATMSIREQLEGHNIPEEVLATWEADGIRFLLPIQAAALEQGCMDGRSCLVIGPTSCGKTFVGELICVKHLYEAKPCLYLVPFKALAEEKWSQFQRRYARPEIGARIMISTADRRESDRFIVDGDFHIAILTFEKLSALLVLHPGVLTRVGAIVIDEIQMVSDDSRGAELELLLTRVRQVAPDLQVVGLSAVVSDLNGFDKWLKAKVISDDHRPVTLREGAMIPAGRFDYVEWISSERNTGSENLCALHGEDQDDLVISFVSQTLKNQTEQILVFVNSVARTVQLARDIAGATQFLPAAARAKTEVAALEATESGTALASTLDRSIAFHNADLTIEERLAIETGFRGGEIRCLVSTSTLSMGVNLPASTVVIADHKKWTRDSAGRWEQVPIAVNEYRNMSGRAGRFGLRTDDLARSVLIAPSQLDQRALLRRYVRGSTIPLISAFLKQPLEFRVLRIFASGLCNTAAGLKRFLLKTFAAAHYWANKDSQESLDGEIEGLVSTLETHRLIKAEDGKKIVATQLGRICASSGLGVETFGKVVEFVKSGDISPFDISLIASTAEEAGPDAVSLRLSTQEYNQRAFHFVTELRALTQSVPSPQTETLLDGLPETASPGYQMARALKFQLIASAFISGIASREIEHRLGVPAGRTRAIGSMCSWICDTAAAIAWITRRVEQAKSLERLSDRFLYGCSEGALFLAHVPHNLHRAERETLLTAGFTTLQKIVDTTPEQIAKTARVSKGRVITLQRSIIAVLGESLELERQQLNRLASLGFTIEPLEALYTAKGTALDQAIEDILVAPFCLLKVSRISPQREGEADLKIILSSGKHGVAQVTAKDRPSDKVGLVKAGAILQQSPELFPEVFICFGRPAFDEPAIKKARAHVSAGHNYKLIPVSVLAEMYVRFHESKLTTDRVSEILEKDTGHVTIDRI